ncbi:MAG: glycosyltransferase [Thermoplasmata archaeon]|nr:glycosyltransferase [Thermoplasmata archaeon]
MGVIGNPMRTSVVVITRNTEMYMADLLDSLTHQSLRPLEVIVADCNSTDRTKAITKRYAKKYDYIHYYNMPGTRGVSRNAGAKMAKGDIIAFVDADAIANALWIENMEKSFDKGSMVVAGREVRLGYEGWGKLKRVGIIHKGQDISYPSVNLAYDHDLFNKIGGFDPWFKEAEELDLNYRAVEAGAKITYNPKAIIYHRVRESIKGFFKQAFWYGFGRKELTLRHGSLWGEYNIVEMVRIGKEESLWKIFRLVVATFGYLTCRFSKSNLELKRKWRESELSSR